MPSQTASHSRPFELSFSWFFWAAIKILVGLMFGAWLAIALGPGWETFLAGTGPWPTAINALLELGREGAVWVFDSIERLLR